MTHATRKSVAILLALSLALLPFSASFGFYMADSHASMSSMHMDTESACNETPDDSTCHLDSQHVAESDTDEECCIDHCDIFSGDQIDTECSVSQSTPRPDTTVSETAPWIPELPATLLLRPPTQHS